jgi:flavodoxin
MSTLVIYFSAEGTTAKVAKEFAEKIGAELYEIVPQEPYTAADIKWTNPLARCNKEQFGKKDVPVYGKIENLDEYDTIYIGFPIWYGQAPRVVYTFCKGYDWTGKTIHAFATSGGSGIGKTAEKLSEYVRGAASVDAKLVHSAEEI